MAPFPFANIETKEQYAAHSLSSFCTISVGISKTAPNMHIIRYETKFIYCSFRMLRIRDDGPPNSEGYDVRFRREIPSYDQREIENVKMYVFSLSKRRRPIGMYV